MENRWSMRRLLALDVRLFYRGWEFRGCKTRDIGLGGMFVETGDVPLPKYAPVELVFARRGGRRFKARRTIKARVVRVADSGVGLMFRDFDVAAFRAIQDILMRGPEAVH